MTDHPTPQSWLSADEPIQTAQDRLNRKEFARELGAVISTWVGEHSLTLALNGAWGSGESSIKNMAVETLKQRSMGASVDCMGFRAASTQGVSESFRSGQTAR
jgi:hypothetical protein